MANPRTQSSSSSKRSTAAAYQSWSGARFTAKIPGRFVNPAKLENFLDRKFDDYYTVERYHAIPSYS
ncbi:hypothetical protein JMJ77_0012876 [Colletotrichum scovillei]|uniref:Uncharacterized protein n=1 Tax=Colletotrichum scovillei TaxID=1209932 RepID=A0A9P7R6F1_9PEZI|nr:hypothetical protein JMJ77_0012876 [Colletotrichum scovillei]KAG7069162.1 hypothetical protein JMJ76_0002837 [Colletotrichum scovillei]KAG7073113.1 hypothetical protein JMJ78_0014093 [Colletotrichum scovillei]